MLQFNNNSTLEKVTRIKCGIAMCKKFACGQSYLLPIVETSNLFNYIRCLNCSDERLWQIERKKKLCAETWRTGQCFAVSTSQEMMLSLERPATQHGRCATTLAPQSLVG
jgi:hypothetical protein